VLRRFHRSHIRLLLGLLLASSAMPLACRDPGPPLRRLEMPDGGVGLRWALEPGHALVGHLRVGSTRQIEGMARPLDQSLECDVTMQVLAPIAGRTGTRLRATFSDIELEWGLPPSAEYGTEEFIAMASERLRKLQPWIELGPDGAILATSEPPTDMPAELAELYAVLTEALEATFFVLPAGKTERGGTWTDTRARESALGSWTIETRGRIDGLYRLKERELDVVALEVDTSRRSHAQGTAAEGETHARVLFAVTGYVAEIDRETQAFSADSGMVYRKIRADWRRTREIVPELVGGGDESEDVQLIRDPCNPDYVGPLQCDEPGKAPPTPEPATSGEPPTETPAADPNATPDEPEDADATTTG
jgi:hypothetical protein